MTADLFALCIDAHEPQRLARFWSDLLRRPLDHDVVLPDRETGFPLHFLGTDEPKTQQNQMHVDLTSTSPDDQRHTVERALELGGRHIDIGQGADEPHVVLADPEGNEFCVLEPNNGFLAGCPFLGCLASDGSYEVGRFWHAVLAWPLVWDEGEETAIQQHDGGSKISWGGRPFRTKAARNRLHFDLAVEPAQHDAEVDRLVSLGARAATPTHHLPATTAMVDPDGNEFCLLTRR